MKTKKFNEVPIKTEYELEKTISLLKATIESTNDGLLVVDKAGKILQYNNKFANMWNIPADILASGDDENLLKYVLDQLKYPDEFLSKVVELYAKPEAISFDTLEFKDGKIVERYSQPQWIKGEPVGRVWSFLDVTSQKLSSKALKESERKYRDLFEKSDDAILIIDGGKFVDCNQATVRMLLYNSKEELLNTHPSELSPEFQPDGRPSLIKADEMMNLALSKGSHRFEWIHKKSNGELFPVEVLLTAIAVDDNNIIIHTVWRDITERKRAEETIQKERALLRTIINCLPESVYVKDNNYRKILTNRIDLENIGLSKEEVIGKTDFEIHPKEVADAIFKDDKMIIENGISIINREDEILSKDGKKSWWLTSKLPLINETGEITGLLGVRNNITIRKKAELIREAIYEISEAAHNSTDMYSLYVVIHNAISKLMSTKNIFIAIYDEVSGMIDFPYSLDEYDSVRSTRKYGKGLTEYVLRTGKAVLADSDVVEVLKAEGEIVQSGAPSAIWLGVPLIIGGKAIGAIVVQDYHTENTYGEEEKQLLLFVSEQIAQVIERKRSLEEIKKYSQELSELNQTKDKFFSIIAHDLRSPFHGLLAISGILVTDIDILSKGEIQKFSKILNNSIQKQFELVNDLLDWARIQSKNYLLSCNTIFLKKEIKSVIEALSLVAEQKGIVLSDETNEYLTVYADLNMLKLVLRNLISNSIKFTERGGQVIISAKNIEKPDIGIKFVEISVIDNGVGISEEDLQKLFNLSIFHSTEGTTREKGTGLGLMLCKEIVEKHGGQIFAESEKGKGSRFYFIIPALELSGV